MIKIRKIKISDSERLYDILSNPNFLYFKKPKSLEEEKSFIKKIKRDKKRILSY